MCDICLMCVSEVYVQHQEWCMCCVHIMCFRCVECVWCMGVVCELYLSFLVCVVSVCGRSIVNMCGVYVLYMYGLDMVYVCLCGVCVVNGGGGGVVSPETPAAAGSPPRCPLSCTLPAHQH